MLSQEILDRVAISRWKVTLLRAIFPRRWWVQIRGKVYVLRMPPPA